jgi:hypothetical protein
MSDMPAQSDDSAASEMPRSPTPLPHTGPLHLQKYLGPCQDAFSDIVTKSIEHSVSLMRSLHCECMPSGVYRAIRHGETGPIERRTREARRSNIESARSKVPTGTGDKPAVEQDRRVACRFFSLKLNDEEGVVHSTCRRCERHVLLYDRALYWGIKRPSGRQPPETFPYKCSCGGHTFEVAMGFLYPPEALDENDLDTITIAVRCASCNEVAIVFDDEAT